MITGTPYADVFAIALENAGQVWVVDLAKPDFPVTPITHVGRHLHRARARFMTRGLAPEPGTTKVSDAR